VFLCLSTYRTGGCDALRDKPQNGRHRKATTDVMRWLSNAITLWDSRKFHFPFCLWTLGMIWTMLKPQKGIDLSKSGVSRLLAHVARTLKAPPAADARPATLPSWLSS
jgi:transposase